MSNNRYCIECGAKLIEGESFASVYTSSKSRLGTTFANDKFDNETGKRLFLKTQKCPNYKNNFLSLFSEKRHDNFATGEIYTK